VDKIFFGTMQCNALQTSSIEVGSEALIAPVFEEYRFIRGSRDSSVGIATGYGLDDRGEGGSSSPDRVKHFHFSISSTQPPIKWVPGALSRG
jgi:hypothetical protein